MAKPKKRRPYDASGRRQRAAESQDRVIEVAERLFSDRGYTETTMEALAAEAGVAVPTIFAVFGSKRGVLSRLLDTLVSGERGGPSILQTSSAQEVLAEPDRRRALRLFAHHMSVIQTRMGRIHEVMKHAARTEENVAELFARAQTSRYKNLTTLVQRLADRGSLRDGLTIEEAARTIWAIASPEVRQMFVTDAGWQPDRYERWLADTLIVALLPPEMS